MDSFDDLLAPSRNLLEENPFADPFAKRSNSPDPWASPFAIQDASPSAYDTTTHPDASHTEIEDEPSSATVSSETSAPSDPLDSDSLAQSEESAAPDIGPSRTPGFKESIESEFSEIATIRPTHSEDASIPSTTGPEDSSPLVSESTTSPTTSSTQSHTKPLQRSETISSTASNSQFVSPLQQRSPPRIEHSIANLSLGSESLGGWTNEQTTWGGESSSSVAPKPPVDDDSDDDKPIRQTLKLPVQLDAKSSGDASAKSKQLQPLFVISVDDPQKVGDPIRAYTMYTVHTRTSSPLFQKSSFSVLRRYSDFLWLYEMLSNNNPGVVVPPVPEKSSFNRFEEHFVRQRRLALEKCIQKIANHPVLCKDSDLRLFLESDTFTLDIKHRKAELAHERGGLMASIGQTITGPRFHETDDWFDRQKSYLDSLESQLRGLVKAIELVAKHRSELAAATGEFAHSLDDLAAADIGQELSSSVGGLADMEKKYQSLQSSQSEQDMLTFMSAADEYARLINSVRNAFSSRIRVYHSWKTAESDLLRTKQTHEKNRAQGRIPTERLSYSLSQIAEAERRTMEAKHEYEYVSKLVKTEMARFEQERIEDFKNTLQTFLDGMITRQRELISSWGNYQQTILKRVGNTGTIQTTGTATAS
ncbi:hypothetical protein AX17_004186 [Amanita inopinata Kibby_2008]|nr:hypothetical protein AX17_004186 [Amanita inopinata Kibby_2008]